MTKPTNYDEAVKAIKLAILQSQYDAAKSVNEKQIMLYYAIGKYISVNSRNGFWGKGAIDAISERLDRELPGLRGFSARNLRNMRTFYEERFCYAKGQIRDDVSEKVNLAIATAKIYTPLRAGVFRNWIHPAHPYPVESESYRREGILY